MGVAPFWSTVVSLVFLGLGAVCLLVMLAAQGRAQVENYQGLARYHRWCGWLFVLLFLLMFIFMLARIEEQWEESSARIAMHVALATALLLLIILKVAIARYFPKLRRHMFLFGVSLYLAAFTMVWITAGYYIIWKYEETPYLSHAELPEKMVDLELGKQLFIGKCSTCHLLENIMHPRSRQSWETVMGRMLELAAPRITPDEGAQILHYLVETHVPGPVGEEESILDSYCLPCHENRADILIENYSRSDWRENVRRMRKYGPEIIPEEKVGEIVDFLDRETAE
ncbi:MAG: hypothetical protein ABR523_00550 [Desulfurivibrionaceae bacterium]